MIQETALVQSLERHFGHKKSPLKRKTTQAAGNLLLLAPLFLTLKWQFEASKETFWLIFNESR